MKTLKRLSRLYPQELTEHFIYLPAVSMEQLSDHAAMQDWLAQYEVRLRTVEKSGLVYKASLREDRERNVWLPEVELIRSEEHTSELQSLMRISYAVFCLKKKNNKNKTKQKTN